MSGKLVVKLDLIALNIKGKTMIERLLTFFKKPKEETKGKVPSGLCPNCWGTQEYAN